MSTWYSPSVHPTPLPRPLDPFTPFTGHLFDGQSRLKFTADALTQPSLRHTMFLSAGTDPYPDPRPLLIAGWSSLKFAGECTHTARAYQVGDDTDTVCQQQAHRL